MSASDRAAEWLARMRGPDAGAHRAAFEAWLALPGNAEAYRQAEDDWAFSGSLSRSRIEAMARKKAPARTGMRWAFATLAVVAIGIGVAGYSLRDQELKAVAVHDQEPGQQRLADGSLVTLTGGARVQPQFNASERRILLSGGVARFEVAHDAARPFIVVAGLSETRALGTVFEVDLREAKPRISLIRGAVEVRAHGSNATLRLSPGESAEVSATGPRRIPVLASPVPTSLLEADGLPLGAIIETANRNTGKPIRMGDPAMEALKVSGRFDTADNAVLARKLAAALDLTAVDRGDAIILMKK